MAEFENLPKGWAIAKLGELVITEKGKKPKRISKDKTKECSIPYVNIKAFEKNIIDEYTDGLGCVLCEDDDFLMVWDGSRSGYVGKAIKGALGSTLVRIKLPLMNQDYVYYFLQSKFIEINTRAKGVGIPHVDPNLLWNYDFHIAPLPEQTRILAKLEQLLTDLDKGIEYLETTKQQLKVYRESVLKWAFEGKLTNKNLKQSEMTTGWTKTTLGEIVKKVSVKALPTEMPEARFIGMDCIESNAMKPYMTYQFNQFKSAGNSFKVNHVLYGRMRPYLNKVYKAEFDGVCSGEFIIMECLDNFNPELLKYILHQRDFVRFANQKTSGDRPRVSFEELEEYPIFKCSPTEQNLIVQEIESRLSVCDKIEETIESSLQQAEALRLSIIKKAFEGKLVPQDRNDEPAEKLLQQLRIENYELRKKKK
ncbi:MAG: restriction endonuclease subunit S [Chitinophagaceae bacterium]|nr:restriction endonuclease subunit S [Chitinophagaceae bacterium]